MNMKKIQILIISFLFISVGLVAQKDSRIDFKQLDEYYAKMVKDWDVPGASIGIVKDGKLVFTGNYGVLEEGGKAEPNENTLYAIASNSKAFTATVIGMLVQEGKLNWNDKVKKYLPYFALYDPWVSEEVTIRDLLSHRVGLGTFSGDIIWYKSILSSEEIIKRIKYVPKAYNFRSGYGYSNVMFITAGELIKKVTGKSWNVNVKERILEPLGMSRTITSRDKLELKGNFAIPHAREENVNIPIIWEDWEEVGALGGVISSVRDVSEWMIFNMNSGVIGKDTLLASETLNMIWTPHNNFIVDHINKNETGQNFGAYGLGWGLSDYHSYFKVSHTGGFDGMITAITMIPDENLGVVVLTNGLKSPISAATNYALDMFLGIEEKDWSSVLLAKTDAKLKADTRVSDRKNKRVLNTVPSISTDNLSGVYKADIYGEIRVSKKNDQLRLDFEYSPSLSATLSHWHYDVWKINWDNTHAWFNFGTIKFLSDNNMDVKGLEFDVPNDDIFFEELKVYKVN